MEKLPPAAGLLIICTFAEKNTRWQIDIAEISILLERQMCAAATNIDYQKWTKFNAYLPALMLQKFVIEFRCEVDYIVAE